MARTKFSQLKTVFDTLHGPKGCMWDKRQTHKTLIPGLLEEAGEFIRAARNNNTRHMKEELGDILLHVMFHAKIAQKKKKFDIEDVIDGLIKKLRRRHPHVFGKTKVTSTRQIIANWNKIKSQEKRKQ